MKSYKLIIIILIVFLKTGNVLSNNNIFDVNNIEIEKKGNATNEILANIAIKKSFEILTNKILLKRDLIKLRELKLTEIKELVKYYQISKKSENNIKPEKINFNISFDKDKIHDLFYKKRISYSEINNKELFILPILKKNNQIFIYNNNFFYNRWNEINKTDLIDFILPLESIEIIQKVNLNKNNLLTLQLEDIFREYPKKNLTLVLIEDEKDKKIKIYLKSKVLEKNIIKNINIEKDNLSKDKLYTKIIIDIKDEIINLIKSKNLIDITAPSFLNVQFKINKKNNLVELKSRIKKIDAIENIYIQKLNSNSIFLKIKYLGKINKIIRQLENHQIRLELLNDQWSIKFI